MTRERDWDEAHQTEEEGIEAITEEMLQQQKRDYPAGSTMGRKVHKKNNGAAFGKLRIFDVPEHLQHGFFKEPKELDIIIRTSNGSGKEQPDSALDVRAFSFLAKLTDKSWEEILQTLPTLEPGMLQGFALTNHNVFFARDLASYHQVSKLLDEGGNPLSFLTNGTINPFSWRWRELCNLVQGLTKKLDDPLVSWYFTQLAVRYGPYMAKFAIEPTGDLRPGFCDKKSDNFLREAMTDHLKSRWATFNLLVQLQRNPDTEPSDDPTVPWNTKFEKVGELYIRPQEITPEKDALANGLIFSPGYTIHHPPQGEIGRVRARLYPALGGQRRKHNGIGEKK